MKKISDILGKPVLSLYEGETEGIINNVIFDKNVKKLKWIILFEDGEFQEEKIVNVNQIFSFGENAVIIKNKGCLNLKEEIITEENNPINNLVYTTTGCYLGKIKDVLLKNNKEVEFLELDSGIKLSTPQIASSSKNTLIIQEAEKRIRIANYKKRGMPKNNSASTVQEVRIMPNVEIQGENKMEQKEMKYSFGKNSFPLKFSSSNYEFLLGRKAGKNIYTDNQELIIKKDNKITLKTISIAKMYGKLRELTVFSN